jgi:hypothetical protein
MDTFFKAIRRWKLGDQPQRCFSIATAGIA